MFKNFSRRQGTAIAAAAVSAALLAPSFTPVADAQNQGSSSLSTVATAGSSAGENNGSSAKRDRNDASSFGPVNPTSYARPSDKQVTERIEGDANVDAEKCAGYIIGYGIPLAALVPFALASQLGLGGLASINEQFNQQIREANTELQRQAGILNEDLARQVQAIDSALENYGLNLTSAILGLATTAAAIAAAASIISACTPPAEGGSSIRGNKTTKTTTPKATVSTTSSAPASASTSSETTKQTSSSTTTTSTSAESTSTSESSSAEPTTSTTTTTSAAK